MNAIASKAIKSMLKVEAKSNRPTDQQFGAYQAAYQYFNEKLFGGTLAPCLLNFSRKNGMGGFFWAQKWATVDGTTTHEISINPDILTLPVEFIMSILVHEQAHQWQYEQGKPSRNGYHNQEWAAKMVSLGLIPSDTGKPDGKQVGQKMSHYVQAGGAFEVAFKSMPESFILPWRSAGQGEKEKAKKKKANKSKYTCPGCSANVWGKPELNVICGDCGERFEMEEPGEGSED